MYQFLRTACVAMTLLAFIVPSNLNAQEAAAKKKSISNLKKIAKAMIAYHDVYGYFPPPTVMDREGKKILHSWRVELLPFLEEDNLYNDINKLKEPWDSEKNKKNLERLPKVYAPVTGKPKEKNTTHYQYIVGDGAMFESRKKITLTDIKDGTSNTIMIVEAEVAVPWMKPADLTYDPKKELPKFGGLFKEGFHAAFADGHVRFIGKDADKDAVRALITRAGGEVIDVKKLK